MGNQFGVGKSTAGALLMEVVRAINTVLLHRVIRLSDLDPIITGFATLGFPNRAGGGATDGTHIPIRSPHHHAGKYINSKGYFFMVLQSLVNQHGQFVGWLGKTCDAQVFCNSSLYYFLPPAQPHDWGC